MKCLLHKVCPLLPLTCYFDPTRLPFSLAMKMRMKLGEGKRKWKKRERKKEDGANRIAISQTIQNHKNAIYDLAATVEGLEVRWNDVRGYYSYVLFDLFLFPPFSPSFLLHNFFLRSAVLSFSPLYTL
jgi:hypothetical protein